MQHCREREASVNRRLTGSIRHKLTLFVVLLSLLMVGLVWFLSVFMLGPVYEQIIRNDLNTAANAVVAILDEAERAGLPVEVSSVNLDGSITTKLSRECRLLLSKAVASGELKIDSRCLDISNVNYQNLYLADRIAPRCILHPSHELGLDENGGIIATADKNGLLAQQARRNTIESGGDYDGRVADASNVVLQMVRGRMTGNGRYIVLISANVERIPQAQQALKTLILPISALLLLLAVGSAWSFSRWFTSPLSKMSAATKEMARGNYDVSVDTYGDDELATLAEDFNDMAKEVKRSSELQKDLIANISHDLRTPLTLIKGYAETVRDITGDDPQKRNEQLSVIMDETDRLSALVNSVMELSRMSTGNEKLVPVRFDLSQLCEEVAYRYEEMCKKQGWHMDFVGCENCEVEADPAYMERALHNLLGNAVQHVGSDGYIGLHLKKTPRGTVRVEVIDHGAGIKAEDKAHLFDRYYRSRTDAGKQGTGLGLSITKAIFEAHKFTYGIESVYGQGATFWFEAPLVHPAK